MVFIIEENPLGDLIFTRFFIGRFLPDMIYGGNQISAELEVMKIYSNLCVEKYSKGFVNIQWSLPNKNSRQHLQRKSLL